MIGILLYDFIKIMAGMLQRASKITDNLRSQNSNPILLNRLCYYNFVAHSDKNNFKLTKKQSKTLNEYLHIRVEFLLK